MIATISYSKGKLFRSKTIITVITYRDSSMLEIDEWFESGNENAVLRFIEEQKVDNIIIDVVSLGNFSKKNTEKLMEYYIKLEN